MADGEKRIVELTETQTFGNGDYLPLDNISNSETKKIEAKKLGITYTMTDTEDGFSFDGSNGYHYEKVIPKDAQMSYDDYEDLTEAEKTDGSNRFIPDFPEEVKESEIWTRVGRTPLTTDAKTVSPAINELKGRIDDSDDEITEIQSNLTDLETVTYSTSNAITFVKCGKMRQAIFDWASTANIKSFFTNLSNADKPIYTLVAPMIRVVNSYYANMSFFKYDNGTSSVVNYSAYNNSSTGGSDSSANDVHKGNITWFVN